jgi:hypothetical protein
MLLSLYHMYKLRGCTLPNPCQYYHQYRAIPIYIRFYSIYVKSAE